jgi:PIN domain nuclease of toxin-antitoxin system
MLDTLQAHREDLFDGLIIAQVETKGVSVVSADAAFDAYGITRIW